jgi:hypothetical protein
VLHYSGLERLDRDKHSRLLVPFKSYEENKLLRIPAPILKSNKKVFFLHFLPIKNGVFESAKILENNGGSGAIDAPWKSRTPTFALL